MTSRTAVTSLLALLALSTLAAASCGGEKTNIPPPPKTTTSTGVTSAGGEDPSTTGTGGMGGAGGASTTGTGGMSGSTSVSGTGGAMGCVESSSCPGENTECQTRHCDQGVCGFIFKPDGAQLAIQIDGDCKLEVCDGAGATKSIDANDPFNDKNPCTTDLCVAGGPTNNPSAAGTACSGSAGGKLCDGNGACVACLINSDCPSSVCQSNKCVPAGCTDNVKNGTETDIDCGGMCGKCAVGKVCSVSADRMSNLCLGGTCKLPSCNDGVTDGTETDVDCGGSCPNACAPNKGCAVAADCTSHVCLGGVCQAPSCSDGLLNGNESDVDCGPGCATCALGKKCNNNNTSCTSQVCSGNVCACPNGMKTVPKSGGNGGTYCIDTTEVTNDQYTVFWSASQPNQNLPGVCASKMNFTPKVGWPPGPTEGSLPIVGVDWCDAYAYCSYFGKHLCGKVSGGANTDPTNTAYNDTTKSEWYNACTAQGANDYPYGSSYNNTKCHGVDQSVASAPSGTCGMGTCAGTVTVSSPQDNTCLGGVPGLLGMSGNAAEWENSCDDATNPTVCHIRGGSHCETGAANGALRCDELATQPVGYHGCDVGFRCCF